MQITGPENVKIQLIKVNYVKRTYRLRFVKSFFFKKKEKEEVNDFVEEQMGRRGRQTIRK